MTIGTKVSTVRDHSTNKDVFHDLRSSTESQNTTVRLKEDKLRGSVELKSEAEKRPTHPSVQMWDRPCPKPSPINEQPNFRGTLGLTKQSRTRTHHALWIMFTLSLVRGTRVSLLLRMA